MKTFVKIITILILVLSVKTIQAQYVNPEIKEEKPLTWRDKLFFGGNLGLQFGTITYIEVSPTVGYKITEKFHAGIGIIYKYFNYRDYNYQTSNYGGSVFARYFVYQNIYLYGEAEQLNIVDYTKYEMPRMWLSSTFIGAGYRQPIGERSGLNFMILYNLNESTNSPYQNPIIRVSIEF